MNFTDFDNVAAYCVPHKQRAFPKKMGVDCEQLASLQPDGADVDKHYSAANAERVTVHGGAEQSAVSTATDIYCAPWKQCRAERNVNHAWVCGSICQHDSFRFFVIWDLITVGIYS